MGTITFFLSFFSRIQTIEWTRIRRVSVFKTISIVKEVWIISHPKNCSFFPFLFFSRIRAMSFITWLTLHVQSCWFDASHELEVSTDYLPARRERPSDVVIVETFSKTLVQVAQERLSQDKSEAMKTIIYYDGSREVSGSHTMRKLTFYASPCLLRSCWSYERRKEREMSLVLCTEQGRGRGRKRCGIWAKKERVILANIENV